ncbi:MAG: hypothetical protein ACRYG4_04215 [Janthinobacterium lividum]
MQRMITAQTPVSLTHLIYQAAHDHVDTACDLAADVVFHVVDHAADLNDDRFDELLLRICGKARDRRRGNA